MMHKKTSHEWVYQARQFFYGPVYFNFCPTPICYRPTPYQQMGLQATVAIIHATSSKFTVHWSVLRWKRYILMGRHRSRESFMQQLTTTSQPSKNSATSLAISSKLPAASLLTALSLTCVLFLIPQYKASILHKGMLRSLGLIPVLLFVSQAHWASRRSYSPARATLATTLWPREW